MPACPATGSCLPPPLLPPPAWIRAPQAHAVFPLAPGFTEPRCSDCPGQSLLPHEGRLSPH